MMYKILTQYQLRKFIEENNESNNDLENEIHYFSYTDLNNFSQDEIYSESLRFFVCIKDNKLIAISKCAIFPSDIFNFSLSFLTVNRHYRKQGISKEMIKLIVNYFISNYDIRYYSLGTSKYTPEGYKYFRPKLRQLTNQYNITFNDNYIGFGIVTDEDKILAHKSKEKFAFY